MEYWLLIQNAIFGIGWQQGSLLIIWMASIAFVTYLLSFDFSRRNLTKRLKGKRRKNRLAKFFEIIKPEAPKKLIIRRNNPLANLKNSIKNELLSSGINLGFPSLLLALLLLIIFSVFFMNFMFPNLSLDNAILFSITIILAIAFVTLRTMKTKRMNKLLLQLPEVYENISRGIKVGFNIDEQLNIIIQEYAQPIKGIFEKVRDDISIGMDYELALRKASKGVPLQDFYFFVIALSLQRRSGGSLSDIMASLSFIGRKRLELRKKIKTFTAQGRMSSNFMQFIPIVIIVSMYIFSPGQFDEMLSRDTGRTLALLAGGLYVLGIIMTRSIVNPNKE